MRSRWTSNRGLRAQCRERSNELIPDVVTGVVLRIVLHPRAQLARVKALAGRVKPAVPPQSREVEAAVLYGART